MIAAGTSPNIIYEREYPGTFQLDEWKQFFQGYRLEENNGTKRWFKRAKARRDFYVLTNKDGKFITFYGDNHPIYAGNVVKAMASARDGSRMLRSFRSAINAAEEEVNIYPHGNGKESRHAKENQWKSLTAVLDDSLIPAFYKIERLTPTITEVIVRAPYAASHLQPGQFFRLQNYPKCFRNTSKATRWLWKGLHLPARGWMSRKRAAEHDCA